jgi:hypothetical protein
MKMDYGKVESGIMEYSKLNGCKKSFSGKNIYVMIKNFTNYIKESNEDESLDTDKYNDLMEDIKSMIESTIENSGGEFDTFVSSFNKDPEDFKIEGLINESDIYEFYLKYRNDIDEILNDVKYFDEVPTENNVFGLYEYTINGTERAVKELVRDL